MKIRSLLIVLAAFCLFIHCRKNPTSSLTVNDIGVFAGDGAWSESIPALRSMFHWMGYSVTELYPEDMVQEELKDFKALCFPGGDMVQYAQAIGPDGLSNIRRAIWDGTGYIGICGGGYFAASRVQWLGNPLSMTSLNLFQGVAEGPYDVIVPYPEYNMCTVNITDTLHAITSSLDRSMRILYYYGPSFTAEDTTQVNILGRYEANNAPAILNFTYGSGRVFLIGTHPEIEEDSDRDNCNFADGFDDDGSDWDLMMQATVWCTGSAPD
jgi:biotin--protein ligase